MSTDAFNNISFYAFKLTVLNNKPYEIWTIKTYNVPYVNISSYSINKSCLRIYK